MQINQEKQEKVVHTFWPKFYAQNAQFIEIYRLSILEMPNFGLKLSKSGKNTH